MSFPEWSLLTGVLLITMVLVGTVLSSLSLSSAMIYLGVGFLLGSGGFAVIAPDPLIHGAILERLTEAALLISLFAIGLRMPVALRDRRWRVSWRLALTSMAITVALIAAVGVLGLHMSLGGAVLLGGILAPTDPVLASGIQAAPDDPVDPFRFSLAGEGALNDGTAFPFVLLGLGLLGLNGPGNYFWHWVTVSVLWAPAGGLIIGAALGVAIGNLVVYLRSRHQSAVGLDEFLSLGLIALTYGAAQLCQASGFLAVFAAGLALDRVRERPLDGTLPLGAASDWQGHDADTLTSHSHHASAATTLAVQGFNAQIEKLAELAIVVLVGAMLPTVVLSLNLLWLIPLLFLVLRPIAVWAGTLGAAIDPLQRALIGWFGIRGIGSVFYLMFALHHGVSGVLAQQLVTVTLVTVAVSIVVHGVSVGPLMGWYRRRERKQRRASRSGAP